MKYIWTTNAQLTLRLIRIFLEGNSVPIDIVEEIIQRIRTSPKKLLQFPRLGRLIKTYDNKEVRRLLVKEYKLFYELRDDIIFILKVLHDKEDIEGI